MSGFSMCSSAGDGGGIWPPPNATVLFPEQREGFSCCKGKGLVHLRNVDDVFDERNGLLGLELASAVLCTKQSMLETLCGRHRESATSRVFCTKATTIPLPGKGRCPRP